MSAPVEKCVLKTRVLSRSFVMSDG